MRNHATDRMRGHSTAMPEMLPKLLKTSILVLYLLALQLRAAAQCAMPCDASQNVLLDADCSVQLMPTDILTSTPPCAGPYILYLVNAAGDTIPNSTVTAQHIGQTLVATVYHPATTNSCSGVVRVFDSLPPALVCPDLTVACNANLAALPFPSVTDNCGGVIFSPPVNAAPVDGACTDNFTQKIVRTWTARDGANNSSTCTQTITLRRPTLADVVPPKKRDTIAVGVVANPSLTGQPTIAGRPVDQAACDIASNYSDRDTIAICLQKGNLVEYTILREWLTVNLCPQAPPTSRRDTQYIVVKDRIPPTIICPPNSTVSTNIDQCVATINSLPQPIVSPMDSVAVSWQFGSSFGPYNNVPPGDYTLTYRVSDCSHVRTCTTKMEVEDTQAPTVKLVGNFVMALSAPSVTMSAAQFNNGSFDNCASLSNLNFTASLDGVNFTPTVTFDCSMVGTQVMVRVKVCEAANPDNCNIGMVAVSVQDKHGPVVTFAPPNITVDCQYDYLNPTVGGSNTPVFVDNCGVDDISLDIVDDVNSCGEGQVRRVWTATDVHGNRTKFTQIVTVTNTHPFTEANITWPLNYQTTDCGASLAIDQIPVPFREPVIDDPGCAMIAVSHTDQIFNVGGPACNKIMRKWTVVDWCNYDPNFPNAGGRWSYTQVLQVMDGLAPTLTVPNDLTVSVGSDCLKGAAVLPDATATDCSTALSITHNSSYATTPGANASGNYPLGTHLVTFRAADGCGNVTQKTTRITVTDNVPPTAVCHNGLSASVTQMAGGVMVMLDANLFNAGSTDHCTPANQLNISIKKGGAPGAAGPSVTFDCSEKGLQIVELHVTDLKGNTGKCLTYVLIQDNLGLCPITSPTLKATVAGAVETEAGDRVQGVTVSVPNFANAVPVATDSLGAFVIPNLPMHGNYDVKPTKDGDDLNGVSTWDLSLLSKHILGVQPLPTPYKMIAADVNRNGSITSFDALELRKLILGIYDQFPDNSSWRFVDKNFQFPQPSNPFQTAFPEVKSIANLEADSAAQFVAVKIGDLNGNAQTNSLNASDDRSEMPDFELVADEQQYDEGDAFAFAVKAANRHDITALAFTLEFDPAKIEFDDWAPGALPDLGEGNLSFHGIGEGKITFCWGNARSTETAPGQTLLLFSGRARSATSLSEAIKLNANPTRTEAYGPDGEEMSVTLHFNRADGTVVPSARAYELYQNQPNPFTGATTIGFHLPATRTVTLSIFDAAGRLVVEKTQAFERGHNEWLVQAHELPQRGVFSYRVSTEDWTATRKMVRN